LLLNHLWQLASYDAKAIADAKAVACSQISRSCKAKDAGQKDKRAKAKTMLTRNWQQLQSQSRY
jgi:hypothetical protein